MEGGSVFGVEGPRTHVSMEEGRTQTVQDYTKEKKAVRREKKTVFIRHKRKDLRERGTLSPKKEKKPEERKSFIHHRR